MNNQFLVMRPVRAQDLPAILEIAEQVGPGFTSLPNDKRILEAKIARSFASFSEKLEPRARTYFFVLENFRNKEIAGTGIIEAAVGHPWPIYHYKLSTLIQNSPSSKKTLEHQILHLVNDYQDAAELATLFLKPEYRGGGRGEFLSRSRCLFISEFLDLFPEKIISELRAVVDKEGMSPFWEAIGRRFFDMSYKEADHLRSAGGQFIAELMPPYPIYVDMLPESAQKVLGKTHEKSAPALHILKKEGFQYRNFIDIFDGALVVEANKRDLKTVRESRLSSFTASKPKIHEGPLMLLSNAKLDFRATLGRIEFTQKEEIILEEECAKALNVKIGEHIRVCDWR